MGKGKLGILGDSTSPEIRRLRALLLKTDIKEGVSLLINITYNELVDLRNSGNLVPGQMYRMIDYETTTYAEGTCAAGHPFDLILTAIAPNALSEQCSAIWSERDTEGYFANSNLLAWKINYTLDNDVIRFSWAKPAGLYLKVSQIWYPGDSILAYPAGELEYEGKTYHKWTAPGGWVYPFSSEIPEVGDKIHAMYTDPFEVWTDDLLVEEVIYMEGGKGVIYKMVDEFNNDVGFDFKNILFTTMIDENLDFVDSPVPMYTFSRLYLSESENDEPECMDWSITGNVYSNFIGPQEGMRPNLFICQYDCLVSDNSLGNYCAYNTLLQREGMDIYSIKLGHSCFENFIEGRKIYIGNSSDSVVVKSCETIHLEDESMGILLENSNEIYCDRRTDNLDIRDCFRIEIIGYCSSSTIRRHKNCTLRDSSDIELSSSEEVPGFVNGLVVDSCSCIKLISESEISNQRLIGIRGIPFKEINIPYSIGKGLTYTTNSAGDVVSGYLGDLF